MERGLHHHCIEHNVEHGMHHHRTPFCRMHFILHTFNSKTCKVYSMEQFHNTRDSRAKGYERGNSLIYIGRHTYYALQKAQCGQGLGNPMNQQCIWAYILRPKCPGTANFFTVREGGEGQLLKVSNILDFPKKPIIGITIRWGKLVPSLLYSSRIVWMTNKLWGIFLTLDDICRSSTPLHKDIVCPPVKNSLIQTQAAHQDTLLIGP